MVDVIVLFKTKIMRGDSNTLIYIIGGIILVHFVIGFIWLAVKMSKKRDDSVDN